MLVSEDNSKWAKRDSTIHASKAVNSGLLDSSENDAVTPAVANPPHFSTFMTET